jgi:hypothetical protein
MAQRIEIKGPFRYCVVGLLILFFAGSWLAPDLVAGLTGSGSRSWRLLRSGHIEHYHRNLTDHWITAERGMYETGVFPALGGEDVIVAFDVDQTEGSVGFRLIRYDWGFWPEYVWSEGIGQDRAGRFRITVPATGLYELRLSYSAFAGDVAIDWSVD